MSLPAQTKTAFEVKADLPGVEKKDIKVNIEGDVLSISHEKVAKKEDKKEENSVKYHVGPLPALSRHAQQCRQAVATRCMTG